MTPMPPAPETSLRDSVTGLYNRKHLLQRMADLMARADRERQTFALILWDIDGFVRFNNQYGQKSGDEFLKKVSDLIRSSLRVYDEGFRSGPDEFCVLLFPANQDIASDVITRIKESVSRELFKEDKEYAEHRFSISGGVVFYPKDTTIPEALIHSAEQELYKARRK